jgi:hypothetical protein
MTTKGNALETEPATPRAGWLELGVALLYLPNQIVMKT